MEVKKSVWAVLLLTAIVVVITIVVRVCENIPTGEVVIVEGLVIVNAEPICFERPSVPVLTVLGLNDSAIVLGVD
jgi:hypothetical protein